MISQRKIGKRTVSLIVCILFVFTSFFPNAVYAYGGQNILLAAEPENPEDVWGDQTWIPVDEEHFPDEYFRSVIIGEVLQYSGRKLEKEEALNVTIIDFFSYAGWEGADDAKCRSLKGIEYFTNLKLLYIDGERAAFSGEGSSIDLRHNRKLERIYAPNSGITEYSNPSINESLKVLSNLRELNLSGNKINEIDISNNPNLNWVRLKETGISSIDISKNKNLETLDVRDNQIESINVDNNTKLGCLFINNNRVHSLDLSKITSMRELECANNELSELDVSKQANLIVLDVSNNKLKSLKLDNNKKLEYLKCSGNNLVALDASVITQEEYQDDPESTDDYWFDASDNERSVEAVNLEIDMRDIDPLWDSLKVVDYPGDVELTEKGFILEDESIDSFEYSYEARSPYIYYYYYPGSGAYESDWADGDTCLHVSLTVNHGKSLKNAIIEAKSGKTQVEIFLDGSNDGEEEEQIKKDSLFRVVVDGKEIPHVNEDSNYNYSLVYSYPSRGKISVKAVDAHDGAPWTGESKEFTFDIKYKCNFGGWGSSTLMVDGLENQVYTGAPIVLDLDVYYAEENELHYYERFPDSLIEGKDYTVAYSNNVNVGTATVTLTGIGEYVGTVKRTFKILDSSMDIGKAEITVSNPTFVPYVKEPSTKVKLNGVTLTKKTDYKITDISSYKAGTATAVVRGVGKYGGEQIITYKILPANIKNATVRGINDSYVETGKAIKIDYLSINVNREYLEENTDYTLEYKDNVKGGTAKVIITGKGNYKGTITKEFNITHNKIKKVNAKKATCTTDGNKAYWTCATCKKVFSDSKATKETTLAAVAIKKLGHKYGDWTKLNSKQHQRVCKTDKSHVQKKDHTWDKGKVTKKATETATGVKTYTCTECKATKKETIPKLEAKVQKNIRRAYGESRYETAFAIADAYLVDSGKVKSYSSISGSKRNQTLDAIVVACGTNFPDALAASYFASSKKAPVILWREKDNAKVQEYIKANLKPGKRVYIMGGTGAVGSSIAKGLSGYKFTRLGGENRYETNIKILNAAGVKGGEILVCDGTNFENALIASAAGKPILLVKPNGVTREGINFVAGLKNPTFTIVGSEKSIAASAVTQLKKYGKVTRITGSNPDQVSVNVAKKYFKNPKGIIVATSNTFADALCGGVLAIKNKSPILLVTDSQNSKSVAYAKALTGLERVTALGGTAVVSDTLAKKVLNVGTKKVNALEYYRTVDKNKRGELKVRSGKV